MPTRLRTELVSSALAPLLLYASSAQDKVKRLMKLKHLFHRVIRLCVRPVYYSGELVGNVREQSHKIVYDELRYGGTWMGVRILKSPDDLLTYHEVIWETRPDWIIECGTALGGSALFFACMLDLIGAGRVLTIDVDLPENPPKHPRLTYIKGSSVSETVVAKVRETVGPDQRCMVVLDSEHSEHHVRQELEIYSQWIGMDTYLVVEDTNVNGHPVFPQHGPGPYEATQSFLKAHPEWTSDPARERWISFSPGGWLRRARGHSSENKNL